MAQALSFEQFRSVACIVLGGVVGLLIGLPISLHLPSPLSVAIPLASLALGIISGYRHRQSIVFFYFALACVCVLSAVVGTTGLSTEFSGP